MLFSSRQPLVELKKWQAEHYLSLDLKTLPHQDGAELLQALGVTGKAAERQAISQDLNGHALSLVLMGHLLVEHHQGDPRYAKELERFPLYQRGTEGDLEISPNPSLEKRGTDSDAEKDSRHALRVLDYYDSLQDAASRCFLQLLGLFDRPMNAAEKAVLIAKANHAEPLRALTAKQWQAVEQRLEKSGLLLGKKGTFDRLEWDTHPIIRSYFGQKFKENYPETFKQAHFVLFDFYQKLPEKELPDTLEEMLPLYRAVVHGCLAEEYQNVFHNVYLERISRTNQHYSQNVLNAYSQDLSAASSFFPRGWSESINSELTEEEKGYLLSEISYCLTSLGRLEDAIAPREKATSLAVKQQDWVNAARSTENLTDLLLPLGKLHQAETTARMAISYSEQSEDKYFQIENDCKLATVLHRLGLLEEAQNMFGKAEQYRQAKERSNYPYLISLYGHEYCELLLDTATNDWESFEQLSERGECGLKFSRPNKLLWIEALDHLTLARTYQAYQHALPTEYRAITEFNLAVQAIQKADKILFIPPFYLHRADFYLTQNQLAPAQSDLNSAWEVIKRCGMKLYAVDYLLIHGRYSIATVDFDTALNHYIEAKQLIEETGYHLRDAELDLFAAQICHNTKQNLNSKDADYYLQKAKTRIEEIGQWGLLRVIERDFPTFAKACR